MNNQSLAQTLRLAATLAICALITSACTQPKDNLRKEHQPEFIWKPLPTPVNEDVKASSFTDFDLGAAYTALKNPSQDLTKAILAPLSEIVLNAKFIEAPRYHVNRLSELINVFNTAFGIEFGKNPRSAKFDAIKEQYYQTVFAGCARDLHTDCRNASLFSSDSRHTQNMTYLANEIDAKIEAEQKGFKSPAECIENSENCRSLVEERYRRLAMGMYKRSRYQDNAFSFAYLKYSRMFALLIDYEKRQVAQGRAANNTLATSYLSEVHAQIYEIVIDKFSPVNLTVDETCKFVENSNPFGYSRKQADLFQRGMGVMFELASKYCLYTNNDKTKLSPSLTKAIDESQADKDAFGLSFTAMISEIRKEHQENLFINLGLTDIVRKVDQKDPAFFNEQFFIVDRLFRGHLSTGEVEMMLRNTNSDRAIKELPVMIANYVKVYLVYMVVETNRFMASIYRSDIASDKIFEQALTRSRELTSKWYNIQAQIDLLDKLMTSYIRSQSVNDRTILANYNTTYDLLKAVNRNIHYIAVYPNMIVMNYFLSSMKGSITVNTWFGPVQINADTVLKAFFDGGVLSPWFRFGKDSESLDRVMLLYSLEYLLSTEGLKAFVAKDLGSEGSDRSKFFDVIFTKYIGDTADNLRASLADYQRQTTGNANFTFAKEICDYETQPNSGFSRRVSINFLDLSNYTYTGLGGNSVNKILSSILTGPTTALDSMLSNIEARKTYVKAMLDVIEGDLLRTHAIAKKGEGHPDLAKARAIISEIEQLEIEITRQFVSNHKYFYNCALHLREVERRRANRLYDEERQHLGKIFDMMAPLVNIQDSQTLDAKVAEINSNYFRAKDSGYKFDRLDGLNYRMSKYDLLMRIKQRVETDVFMKPTAKEQKIYGADLAKYLKARSVSVEIPEGIVRESLYSEGTSTMITIHGNRDQDRDDFINQGLALMNGKPGSYVQWLGQMHSDKTLYSYIVALEGFYLLEPLSAKAKDPTNLTVTAEDLATAYIRYSASATMDEYDVEYSKIFGSYGRYEKDFFQAQWFEKDGLTRLPFFYSLVNDVATKADISLEGGGAVGEALDFAQKFNSLQAFVFQPSTTVPETVAQHYGARIHNRLQKIIDLDTYLAGLDKSASDVGTLNPALTRPFYLEGNNLYSWYTPGFKNLVDTQKARDHRFLIGNLIQRSGNFYKTRESVNVQP